MEGDFAPGYYFFVFEDPDGIRLEVNFIPGKGLLVSRDNPLSQATIRTGIKIHSDVPGGPVRGVAALTNPPVSRERPRQLRASGGFGRPYQASWKRQA